jgi:YidC/Oxa1 family membrane protein insertase
LMFANIFTTLIVQPIFNLLVLIYAILPGHNFGLAIIIFTVIVRLALWPLVKKQLNHAKAMRELTPEIKKIKQAAKGDKQKESAMTMELYKEREINPFASIGILIVQLPILIGLYSGLNRIIHDPHTIVTFSYPFIQHLSWIQELSHDISKFDDTLLSVVNLTKPAIGPGGTYWIGILLAAGAGLAQFYQSRQLMPQTKDSRSLRRILSEAGSGKSADQSEVNAAVGRSTIYLVPIMVFIFALRLAMALPLYWLTSSLVAVIQQGRVLRDDAKEADDSVSEPKAAKTSGGLKITRKTAGEETEAPKAKTKKSPKSKRTNRRRRK